MFKVSGWTWPKHIQTLSGIAFDQQDANLFLVEDAHLRADALKHSILPRLRIVMNVAISLIRKIYNVEVLDDSIISAYPNFRQKREHELQIKYENAFVGIGGQRKKKWFGLARKDGKPVQILPFRFAFMLHHKGICTFLENGWLKGLDVPTSEKLLRFHIENEHKINPLCFEARMRPSVICSDTLPLMASLFDQYEFRIQHQLYDNHFVGFDYPLPVLGSSLVEVVHNFVCFFPVYDSYLQISQGSADRLDELIVKLSHWLQQHLDGMEAISNSTEQSTTIFDAVKSAESKARVMPALRWQIFQRDHWKCVACGRRSHDGAILHVDHIIPRSHGGSDKLENLQTLCNICNIGKSNRDTTDLRNLD
ncbi:HNH endonuclease [Thiolinea disciformis]|uniref:HNH endonuclease n=1 Tax=Thiolinea disciformis TaxID=125614 RepID=UPI00037F4FDC|nr:HNH endonuclease [Thiolinea disciformis]